MDKRTLLQLLLFSVVIITGCSKYEDEDYSCNKEVNQWAKSNLNEIKKMKVAEWYSINDIVYQKAAYVAFDSNQRKELWLSKLQETLKLDWTNAEKEHISKLIYLIEDNSNLFDNKVSVDDKTDLAIYQWKEYALEQLRWDHELIFSIIKTPEKLNANKKLDTSLYKTPATKNNSESDGNKQPLCNCNSNESHKWFLCSLWFHKCHIGVCEVRSKDCSDLWLYECNGLCV